MQVRHTCNLSYISWNSLLVRYDRHWTDILNCAGVADVNFRVEAGLWGVFYVRNNLV